MGADGSSSHNRRSVVCEAYGLAKNVDDTETRESSSPRVDENWSLWLRGDSAVFDISEEYGSGVFREGHDALLGALPTQQYL
jgi:hypothetical protein